MPSYYVVMPTETAYRSHPGALMALFRTEAWARVVVYDRIVTRSWPSGQDPMLDVMSTPNHRPAGAQPSPWAVVRVDSATPLQWDRRDYITLIPSRNAVDGPEIEYDSDFLTRQCGLGGPVSTQDWSRAEWTEQSRAGETLRNEIVGTFAPSAPAAPPPQRLRGHNANVRLRTNEEIARDARQTVQVVRGREVVVLDDRVDAATYAWQRMSEWQRMSDTLRQCDRQAREVAFQRLTPEQRRIPEIIRTALLALVAAAHVPTRGNQLEIDAPDHRPKQAEAVDIHAERFAMIEF